MTALTVLPGAGERCPLFACTLCGVPTAEPGGCAMLARHLDSLRQRGHSEATIYGRRRQLARLGAELPVPVLDATAADLAVWRAALKVTPDTAAHYISAARMLYAWAAAEGIRDDDPAAALPVPKLGRRLPRPIAEADLMHALQLAPPRIRPWLVLAAWCGLRAKEIALLRAESVMTSASPPVLLVTAEATKGCRERLIPLSAFVVAELARARLPASGYVFRRLDGQPGPCTPGLISHYANIHLHECGIAASLHSLRHFFGTGTYAAAHDLRVVQELLGHQSPATTAIYAAWSNEGARAAVEALPTPGRRS